MMYEEKFKDDFIEFSEAKELQSIGYNDYCFAYYDKFGWIHYSKCHGMTKNFLAPTYAQAFRWFRDNKNIEWPIETWVQPFLSEEPRKYEAFYWQRGVTESIGIFETHNAAEIACLKKAIELTKTHQAI